MSPRGEAKQEKGTHKREREGESLEHARILLSQLRERIVCVRPNALTLTHTLGKRTIGMRATERERAGVEDRRKSMRQEGMLGFITITKQQTKNEKNRKAVLE